MKNGIGKQIVCLLGMVIVIVVVYFAGYQWGKSFQENDIVQIEKKSVSLEGETQEEILTRSTGYVLESYNLDTDILNAETLQIPVELIGLSRAEVVDYIGSHPEQFQQKNEKIKNISMISFSEEELVIRKDYIESVEISETVIYKNENPYLYYMVLEEGILMVYKQDKTTVFMETGITQDELAQEEIDLLRQGIGVKNISELYRYLESYTS